jgi:ATP-dependent DNA ligase
MKSIQTYKSKIASRYVPVNAEQIGLKIAESEYYIASVKYDGHLTFLSVSKGKAQIFDRNGNELKIDKLTKAASSIKEDVIFAGELCCFEKDKPTTHREVNVALAKPEKYDLRFGAFDLLEHNGKAVDEPPKERLDQVKQFLNKGKEIFAIEQLYYESRKDLISFFTSVSQKDAEGIIVKVPNGITYKVKQSNQLDLVVLGYAESIGERAGWLREILLGFAIGKNQFQILTKCGGGFSDNERQELPKQLEKLVTNCEYTEVSGAKTAFIFIKPEMVVEISCLDLINENSEGAIRKPLLTFDPKNGYSYEGNVNTLSVISPNFIRIRTDKKPTEKEAGTSQAYALTEPLKQDKSSETNKNSEIIHRDIYTKGGKGGTAIRKFVGMKTNKEETGVYAPFVVVYTDYSASRKTPLEQEIFLCSSEKDVKLKLEELKAENIKKGWNPYK